MTHRSLRLAWLLVAAGAGLGLAGCAGSPDKPPANDPPSEEAARAAPEGPAYHLDDKQQHYLWEIEHHGNLLSQHGFKALSAALQRADAAALGRLLAADFTGGALNQPNETTLRTEVLDLVRQTESGRPPLKLNREQFVERLLQLRRNFGKTVKVKLALMGLTPTDPDDLERPWRGTGQLRLWGEREPGQPCEVIVYLQYLVKKPTTENLAGDGWLTACSFTQSQVGHARRYLLREVAAQRGIDPAQFHDNWKLTRSETITGGVFLCDFNRDGILDLLVTDLNGYFLYKGLPGGRFENVTTRLGLPALRPEDGPNLVACFADLDGDGWEDLILGRSLYRNDGGQRFVNITARTNLRLPADTSGLVLADYDRDGLVDIYVTRPGKGKAASWLSGKSGDRRGNILYHNKGNWRFEDVTAAAGVEGGLRSTFTAAWLDADNDGWPDLYVPNEFGDGVLYHNEHNGTFRGHVLTDHPCDFGTMGLAVGDVDNDGNIDLYAANMYSKAGSRVIANMRPDTYPENVMAKMRTFVTGSQLHLNKGGLRFEQKGKAWQINDCGWAYGPALVDLDNDGWLDLHAACGFISRTRDKPDG